MAPKIRMMRDQITSFQLAQDEKEFLEELAAQLGISKAQVVRNAVIASLMSSDDPLHEARQQHVTEVARLDKWRRTRAVKA